MDSYICLLMVDELCMKDNLCCVIFEEYYIDYFMMKFLVFEVNNEIISWGDWYFIKKVVFMGREVVVKVMYVIN